MFLASSEDLEIPLTVRRHGNWHCQRMTGRKAVIMRGRLIPMSRDSGTTGRTAGTREWSWRLTPGSAAVLALVAGLCWTAWLVAREEEYDELSNAVATWPWREVAAGLVLLTLTAVHFVSAALAVRSLSDERLPLTATVWAQLTAGAADRLVPNGVGGLGVNLRYLVRFGVTPGAAASALAVLAAIGIATDAGYGTAVAVAGGRFGLPGAGHELQVLARAGIRAGSQHHWFLLGSLVAGGAILLLRHRRRSGANVQRGLGQAHGHLRDLVRRPGRVSTAAAASTATTMVMSIGFVIAAHTWGVAGVPLGNGALVAVYLLAVAVSSAAPVPPFLGGTEVALVAALTASGYTASSAVLVVLVFRGLMYWLPLPLGLWGARHLRRQGVL